MSSVDLSSSVLDLERVRDEARDALFDALASRRGRKALVLDPRLGAPLMRITEMSSLRQHGVDRLYYLEGGTLETTCHEVVFLVRPRLELMHKLAEVVKSVLDEVDAATREHERAYSGKPANDPSVPPRPKVPRFTVFFVPRRTLSCEKLLDHLGVLGDIEMDAVAMDFIPFERDVISIEHHNAYRDLAVENDNTSLFYVARAIHELQKVTGEAPIVKGKGAAAKDVAEILERLRREAVHDAAIAAEQTEGPPDPDPEWGDEEDEDGDDAVAAERKRAARLDIDFGGLRLGPSRRDARAPPASPHVDMILLLDRAVDPVTPLCTQLTYEGLIDEIIGVKNGAVEVPDDEGKTVKARLDSNDALFRELRDLNFGRACDALRVKSSAIQRDYQSIKESNVEEQAVSEIGGFVRKIKDNMRGQGLDLHATIAKHLLDCTRGAMYFQRKFMRNLDIERACVEGHSWDRIFEHVETMIFTGENVRRVARLLALATLTHGGIPKKSYDGIRREMVHAYGPPVLLLLLNMEAAGLLYRREDKTRHPYPATRRALKLVVDDLDDADPRDVAYAYSHSGYAPATIRLAQAAVRGTWKPVEEALRQLRGPHFEYAQGWDERGVPTVAPANYVAFETKRKRALSAAAAGIEPARGGSGRRPVVLVCFVGGVTHAEISCLRFLTKKMHAGVDFVVATTNIVGGFGMIDSLIDTPKRFEPLDRGKIEVVLPE